METKFDITNKICNRCRVKKITPFDKKKAIFKECNSTNVKCEYCTSTISFSGLRSHIKNSHKEIDLAKCIHPIREPASQIKEIKEESEYSKYCLIYCKLKAKGIDIDKLLEE